MKKPNGSLPSANPIPIRHQNDGRNDHASKLSQLDLSLPVKVRAEFGPETEVKNIIKRYGGAPMQRQPQFTETDHDLDLSRALSQIERAHNAFNRLELKHRQKYKSPYELWMAYYRGEMEDPEPTPEPDKVQTPPDPK